jgi:two-component system nitrogen regulation sensor histidine kinase NtrY
MNSVLSLWGHGLKRLDNKFDLQRKFSLFLILLAIGLGIATYGILSSSDFSKAGAKHTLVLLILDFAVLLAICAIIARKVVGIWTEHKRGMAGARLHVRMTVLFGALAVTPAIIVTVFSVLFFHFGVQSWFSNQVKTGLQEALSVAKAYLDEHQRVIAKDARLMAYDLNVNKELLTQNQESFNNYLTMMAGLRSLTEVIVFDAHHNIIGRSELTIALGFEVVPQSAVDEANRGEVAVLTSEYQDRVRALVRLDGDPARYLYVGRFVDPKVLEHFKKTKGVVKTHNILELKHFQFEVTFVLIFVVVGLLLLMAAIWMGLIVAGQLVKPIDRLISAAEAIRQGNLKVRVQESHQNDELESLTRSFNRMAEQLEGQQDALIVANQQLDERRQFIESILRGVSAGVIGLDAQGQIRITNSRASELLKQDLTICEGIPLDVIIPDMKVILPGMREMIQTADKNLSLWVEKEMPMSFNGEARTFIMHVVAYKHRDLIQFVVTLDDITDLMSAQRKAAWSDVAQRIAHEVKNPLTPIQLSAERLKRKYLQQIQTQPEIFAECIQTIIKYVDQIRGLINEFSAFARMPSPKMHLHSLNAICKSALSMQKQAYPAISFEGHFPQEDIVIPCDEQQILQALTNVLKNAIQSIAEKQPKAPHIRLDLQKESLKAWILIQDNGLGLPAEPQERLTEPYVTFKKGGTGLGLAIVKKIMEDHKGDIFLENLPSGGARVKLGFFLG